MSQWQGDPNEDIMIVVFKGNQISEPFHRQDFFFIDYAYQNDYNALSAKFDNLITVHEGDCYIGQPFNGYALRGDNPYNEIVMVGVGEAKGYCRPFFLSSQLYFCFAAQGIR